MNADHKAACYPKCFMNFKDTAWLNIDVILAYINNGKEKLSRQYVKYVLYFLNISLQLVLIDKGIKQLKHLKIFFPTMNK